jgi:acyl-CoA reductase-like NAD-dependent aldehyde dehydrogenase
VWWQEGQTAVTKPVTAELGCVTPYIVVPGRWSQRDLDYYAEEVVASLVNNAGHNCLKVEVVVTDADWELRDQFVDAIRLG